MQQISTWAARTSPQGSVAKRLATQSEEEIKSILAEACHKPGKVEWAAFHHHIASMQSSTLLLGCFITPEHRPLPLVAGAHPEVQRRRFSGARPERRLGHPPQLSRQGHRALALAPSPEQAQMLKYQ